MSLEFRHKNDHRGRRALLLLVAALTIVGQLAAVAFLADGQVKKAALREAQLSSQRLATARCFENSGRVDRDVCLAQAARGKDVNDERRAAELMDAHADSNRPVVLAAARVLRTVSVASNASDK